jgi:hypothetical protein
LTAVTAATISTPASTATVFLRTGFVHGHRSTVKVTAVKPSDGLIPFRVVAHFDESEAPGLSRIPVGHDADPINGTISRKHGSNGIFGCTEAEVSYKNIFQLVSF